MVTLFDLFDKFVERLAGAVDDDEKLVVEWLADDRLRLELCKVDAGTGEYLEYFYQCAGAVTCADYQ